MIRFTLRLALLLAGLSFLSACGIATEYVTDAHVHVYPKGRTEIGELSATIKSGDTRVEPSDLIIRHPHSPEQVLGHVTLQDTNEKTVKATIFLDINQLRQSRGLRNYALPNGEPLPLKDVHAQDLWAYPIGDAGSHLYIGFDEFSQISFVGLGLIVKNLHTGDTASLFSPFAFNGGRGNGLVGAFTSIGSSQSGVALFFDTNGLLAPTRPMGATTELKPLSPSLPSLKKLAKALQQLHLQKATLEIR